MNTEIAFSYNHHKNVPYHKNRNKFYKEIEAGNINETNIIEYIKKYTKKPLYKKILSKGKKILKKILTLMSI